MIPIEYLWYIIGAVAMPVFILIYLKALKRNRADKERVAMRRERFERTMKSKPMRKSNTGKLPSPDEHWLRRVKLPVKNGESAHWLETLKPKRKHRLDNLRRK